MPNFFFQSIFERGFFYILFFLTHVRQSRGQTVQHGFGLDAGCYGKRAVACVLISFGRVVTRRTRADEGTVSVEYARSGCKVVLKYCFFMRF